MATDTRLKGNKAQRLGQFSKELVISLKIGLFFSPLLTILINPIRTIDIDITNHRFFFEFPLRNFNP